MKKSLTNSMETVAQSMEDYKIFQITIILLNIQQNLLIFSRYFTINQKEGMI